LPHFRRRDIPSFDDGVLLSAFRLTHSDYPSKRAQTNIAIEGIRIAKNAGRIDDPHIVGIGGVRRATSCHKVHPKITISICLVYAILQLSS